MDYISAKIDELVTEIPGAKKSFIKTFVAQPTEQAALAKGTMFGLIEISSNKQKMLELIDIIIEEIQDNYYNFSAKNSDSSNDPEALFEVALQKTNLALAAFLENTQVNVDLSKINLVVGILLNKKLYLTQIGELSLFLFQRLTKGGYRIVNILEISKTPLIEPNPLKLFSQVISGSIGSRDIIALMTPGLLDYFSLERLKNILTNEDGITNLKTSIEELNVDYNFGAVTLQIEKRNLEEAELSARNTFDYQKAAYKDSMRELDQTEQETAKLLTPSVFPEIKKLASIFRNALDTYLTKIRTVSFNAAKKISIPKVKIPQFKSPKFQFQPSPKKVEKKLAESWPYQPRVTQRLKILPATKAAGSKLAALIQKIPRGKLLKKIAKLPTSSKILLGLSIILAVLFFQSVIWNSISNRRAQTIEEFNQIILDAETKKNEAEASLIYRDENKARELLIEVSGILSDLDPPTKTQKEQIGLLKQDIETQLQTLRHIINVNEPIIIANFLNIDNQAKIAPVLALAGSTLYTQNYDNKSIYKVNTQTRIISSIFSLDAESQKFILSTTVSNNEIIFIDENKKVYALTPGPDTVRILDFSINNQSAITGLTNYNNQLYLLDQTTNQVYRYRKAGNGYGSSQAWVRDSRANFSNTVSLAVDGSIYVLHHNGVIEKFQNGNLVDFAAVAIDPPMNFPTKIKTTVESNYLYILDPPSKRLIVIDKEGRLVNQYTADQFTNLQDFIIVEAEKRAYLLDENSIFGIPLAHLE